MPKTRNRFSLTRLTHKERRLLAAYLRKWHKRLEPHRQAIRESERITAEDLRVTITRCD